MIFIIPIIFGAAALIAAGVGAAAGVDGVSKMNEGFMQITPSSWEELC